MLNMISGLARTLYIVLAIVAADNLGFVNRTDQDRSRPATLPRRIHRLRDGDKRQTSQ